MVLSEIGTPFFLIDKKKIDIGLATLKRALADSWGNYIIGYSYKTNSLPWIVQYFASNDCYAEVVSDDEYNLATSLSVKKENIIYNGIAKSKGTFLDAIYNHAIVNIDAEYEVDWLNDLEKGEYAVGVRVNFDLESKCPGQTQCGLEGERFGFCYENGELERVIRRIQKMGIRVSGLHLHKSSKTRMPAIYQAIAEMAVEIAKNYNIELSYVDIGGGFFGGLETKPQFREYFDLVSSILRRQFDPHKVKLIVEPGMALIGSAVDYYSSVVDVKRTLRNCFVVTNGSRTQIDPLMTKKSYFCEIVRRDRERKTLQKQVITGFTCMEHDRLFELNNEFEVMPGDQVIYHKVGAYTMCLSPLFIKWFPNVYLLDVNGIECIRKQWSVEDYRSKCL